jgi:anti-sigma-K factor RskA
MNDIHELAALYVVDALTPEETHEFETHVADCNACQEEVADMRSITEQLSRSAPTDPPPSLRASVLAGITQTAQESSVHQESPGRSGTVISLHRREPSRLPYLVAAASVLLALAFGGWGLQSRQDAQQAGDRQAEIVQLLGADDVHTVSASAASGGSATVVLSRSANRALFVTDGLPALPSNKVYELWTIAGTPVPAGTFTPGDSGSLVRLPPAALTADRIAITVEPEGGSSHPTSSPIMALPLT